MSYLGRRGGGQTVLSFNIDEETVNLHSRLGNRGFGPPQKRDRLRLSKDSKAMRSRLHDMACIRDQDSSDPQSKEAVGRTMECRGVFQSQQIAIRSALERHCHNFL